jgi:hypothetical protein
VLHSAAAQEQMLIMARFIHRLGYDVEGFSHDDETAKTRLALAYEEAGVAEGHHHAAQLVRSLDNAVSRALDDIFGLDRGQSR